MSWIFRGEKPFNVLSVRVFIKTHEKWTLSNDYITKKAGRNEKIKGKRATLSAHCLM